MITLFWCGFFCFNLLIAVLKTHFSLTTSRQDELEVERRKQLKRKQLYDEESDADEGEHFDIKALRAMGVYDKIKVGA